MEQLEYFGHGTTVATNMIIERKGAKTALITTKGFRDLLEIGRQTRPSLYDIMEDKPETLVRLSLIHILKDTSRHWKRRIILLPQSFSGSSAAQCPQYIRTAGSAPYQLIGSLPVFIFQRFPALFLQKDEVGGTLCSLAPYSPFSVWVGVWVKHREPLFLESLRYFYCSSCARSRL